MNLRTPFQAIIGLILIGASSALAAPTCPIHDRPTAGARPNKLFLYFPEKPVSAEDQSAFPAKGHDGDSWLPLKFDVSELNNYTTGTAEELMNAIYDVVTDIFCEFNVQVVKTRQLPTDEDGLRRNTIGIGTDASYRDSTMNHLAWFLRQGCAGPRWGQSVHPTRDPDDSKLVDYGRIWAGTFQACGTGLFGPLRQASTKKWADSIGGQVAHEAAHNYGVSHDDGGPHRRDEDGWDRHLMRAGENYKLIYFTEPRHFSDEEYSVLAKTVGLAMDTLWNWDFTNPNQRATGMKLRMTVLSTESALTLSNPYTGSSSPWSAPALTGPLDTVSFRGTAYNRYKIEWSTGQIWSEGASGQVPPNARFRVGATLEGVNQTTPEAIIITEVTLLDASGQKLPLHPRWVGHRRGAGFP